MLRWGIRGSRRRLRTVDGGEDGGYRPERIVLFGFGVPWGPRGRVVFWPRWGWVAWLGILETRGSYRYA